MVLPDNTRYFIADTETTGSDATDKACELGWIEVDQDLNIIDKVESLIDPQQLIKPSASGIHGLVNADVENSPTIEEFFSSDDPSCYGKKLEGPTVIIGHRIAFDVARLGPFMPGLLQEVCTLRWVRKLYPDADDHKLSTLIYALNLPRSTGAHRVMADIMSAYYLVQHICERTGANLKQLAEMSAEPMEIKYMPFGKHKGQTFDEIPPSYLRWLLGEKSDMDPDLHYTIQLALEKKKNK